VPLVYLIIRDLGIAQFIRRFPLLFEKILYIQDIYPNWPYDSVGLKDYLGKVE
jgi:hypothetical protein